jgi:diaminopimelate epimerase
VEIAFTKMHGAGNDFIMINDMEDRCRLTRDAIAGICSRRRGIGGDGLILIQPGRTCGFAMRYYNRDGGEADMCGNGARCAAAFAFETGIAGSTMSFETRSGIVGAEMAEGSVRVSIGDVRALRLGMRIAVTDRSVHYGICGVPHAVIVVEDIRELSHDEFVRFAVPVRRDAAFGEAGANVNIVAVTDRGRCTYRTYERGVENETEACGTGAVVIAAVVAHLELADPPIRCMTRGNDILDVDLEKTPDGATNCLLAGPVAVSFRGTFCLEGYGHP